MARRARANWVGRRPAFDFVISGIKSTLESTIAENWVRQSYLRMLAVHLDGEEAGAGTGGETILTTCVPKPGQNQTIRATRRTQNQNHSLDIC